MPSIGDHPLTIDPISQPGDLLATKLSAPILHSMIVRRVRLTDLLWTSMQHRLALVTAPAGYGKTTLLGEWIARVASANWPVCWVSLDSHDNDPVRFWSYLVAALREVFLEIQFNVKLFISEPCQDTDCTQLNPLINQVAATQRHFTLVLDDFHDIHNPAVFQSLSYFIEYLPDNCHMIIASRLPPPFPVGRLRARKQLVELDLRDLSFNLAESETFLKQVMKLDLSMQEVETLTDRTEGWIAGLQLAALSLQGRKNPHDLLPDFPQGQRFILDYLTEEVLDRQEDNVKQFLLKTSILEKMSPAVCDALLGNNESRAVLETLEQRNLFLIPLDGQHYWYRYHTLFRDLLHKKLLDKHADEVSCLHMAAYHWLMENDYPEQAVMHALEAGNTRLAAETVESCALQAIIRMDLSAVVRWFNLLPQEIIDQRLRLVIYDGLVSLQLGKVDDLEERLAYVERRLLEIPAGEFEPDERERLHRYIDSVRAAALCTLGDFSRGLDFSQQVLEDLQPEDFYFYGLIEHYKAYAYHAAGRLSDAVRVLENACKNAYKHSFYKEFVLSLSEKARFLRLQGKLHEAAQAYTQAIEHAKAHGVSSDFAIIPQAGLADILIEWNQIEEADAQLVEPLVYLSRSPEKILDWFLMIDVCLAAARNRLLHNDFKQAAKILQMALQSAQAYHFIPEILPEVLSARVDLWLVSGDLASALEWANEKLDLLDVPSAGTKVAKLPNLELLAMVRVFLAADKLDIAEKLIAKLQENLAHSEQKDQLVRTQILKAVLQWKRGWQEAAAFTVGQALRLSTPEVRVRSFLDEGEPVQAVLSSMAAPRRLSKADLGDSEKIALDRLIKEMATPLKREHPPAPAAADLGEPQVIVPMAETLSERELQILLLLARGYSAGDIARELVISVNTSKAHIKNIYQKLDVHSRNEAIDRAVYYQILKP